VANALVDLGVEPLQRVAILSTNCLEYMEMEGGIAGARAIMVPLNWRLSRPEIQRLLERSEACVALVEDRFAETVLDLRRAGALPALRTVIVLGDGPGDLIYEDVCASATPDPPSPPSLLSDPHEIIYTSGTTGEPKGAVWSNGGVIFNALQQVMDFRLTPESSHYSVIDTYYIGGRHDLTWALLMRGGVVHFKRSGGFDAAAIMRYYAEHGITHGLMTPAMYYDVLRLPDLAECDLSAVQLMLCGGAPLSKSETEALQNAFPTAGFIQVYGLTEGGGTVTFVPPEFARAKAGSSGRPSMHAEIRIVDDQGHGRGAGEDGEILVRAPSVTAGYWEQPEMTDETVIDGWLHTGDIGYLDEDGFLYVSGRAKDMIISGGMNIFPSDVEDVLRQHPAVQDVAVIGLPARKWGEDVCAVIVCVEGQEIDEEEIIAFCRGRLASYKKPKSVRVVEELPRTAAGKVKKFVLRETLAPATEDPTPGAG
jgi:acyl-CoA synthetase (AMP-forming)/AMP-acid ligase II